MQDASYSAVRRGLSSAVRARRHALGLTQEQAAHAIGMAVRHYQKLEAGELNITLRTLVRVADALQVSLAALFATTSDEGSNGDDR